MPKIEFKYLSVVANEKKYGKGYSFHSLAKDEFKSFSPAVLGLGDISKQGNYIQALAAFFDLEGFTSFCNQVDSHLVIPEFLQRYTDWLFSALAEKFKEGESQNRITIWGSLPFYAKFLGDGVLFLWDTDYSKGSSGIVNIVVRIEAVCSLYRKQFYHEIRKHVSNPPKRLRCGIARGQIISVGDGNDYVGSCINIAARLQKLGNLTFAFSRRGIDLSKFPKWQKLNEYILKKVELRGIGGEELVYVKKDEIENLKGADLEVFKEP